LGGNHGIQVVKGLTQVIGTPGLLAVLVITAVLYLVYLSTKTIEVIRNLFRLNFLKKKSPKRWARLMRKNQEEGMM
jgi:S-DNA-T family DNA segregation ATPase FtsK/SpoIIIE